jgi:acetylglutamate kinase
VTRLVVKIGGRVAATSMRMVPELVAREGEVVVVHGAGPQITAELERCGIPVEFVHGRRVTSAEAVGVVREALLAVGAEVCAALGPAAIQLAGDEIGLEATPKPELGLVGEPLPSRLAAIEEALTAGRVPVVAPIAVGPLNVNADEAAAALAVGLAADRLLFLSDVPGVFVENELAGRLEAATAERMLEDGAFEGGIVPKLLAAVRAARSGVETEIGATAVVA